MEAHLSCSLIKSDPMPRILFPCLAASLSLGGFAVAQDAPPADETRVLDPVQVSRTYLTNEKFSGTKTLTPVIDVPQSLSVVSATDIVEKGFTNIGDILRYTPGASIGQGEGHRDQITIRGQNTTADFFLDGLRDDVQYFRPLYNIEQVEILRGANAMIFGRGGGGGIINRVTKRPDFDGDFTGLTANVDTFSETSLALDYNTRLTGDVAARVNAFAESLNNHRDVFEGDRFAINPTLDYQLSPDTDFLFSYEFVDDDRVVDRGVPSENGVPVEGFETRFFGSPTENRTTLQAHIARARVDHALSDTLSANATVQYADYDKLYQNLYPAGIDTGAETVTLDGYRDTTDRQNLIIQGNLVADFATGPLAHTLLIGAEYAGQDTANARGDTVFSDTLDDQTTIGLAAPLDIPAFDFSNTVRDRESEVEVLSVYVQDQVDIGAHLKLVAGLRFDQFDITVDDIQNQTRFERTDEEVSPRVGLIYKPAVNLSAYVSYSQSFLPRSGDQFLSLSDTSSQLDPEEFENREIGLKWDIRPDLSLTTAYFELDRDTAELTPDGEDRFTTTSETSGFEIQLDGTLTNWWRVTAGYSYLDSTLASGSDRAQVPENMASIWNRFEVTRALGLAFGVTYQDEQFASADNSVTLPDYTRVDAAAYYTLDSGTVLQLNIENLTDEDYFPDAHSNSNISTGAPLNARFTLRTRF